MPDHDTVFVLNRLNWVLTRDEVEDSNRPIPLFLRIPGVVRLRTFEDEAEAGVERDRLEEEAHRQVNPFCCGGLHLRHQTSFDADRLHDWLLDGGIDPPADRDWVNWWHGVANQLDDLQWQHFWKALDRLTFYEVIQRPRKPLVYLIGMIGWRYNDQGFDPQPEGSKPLRAYRSRERAEAECDDENEIASDAWDLDEEGMVNGEECDMMDRVARLHPFGPELKVKQKPIFYEVVEVELESLTGGAS